MGLLWKPHKIATMLTNKYFMENLLYKLLNTSGFFLQTVPLDPKLWMPTVVALPYTISMSTQRLIVNRLLPQGAFTWP